MPCRWLVMIVAVMPFTLAQSQQAEPQRPPRQSCDGAAFHEFDFWVGTWEVRDREGKVVGTNSVTAEYGSCVIVEHWQARGGGGGMSMNYFDPQAKLWHQNWVSPGVVLQMSGKLANGAMVLQGPLQNVTQNSVSLLRGEWTRLPDGRVRQLFTESKDAGKTWTEWFDGYYTRAASP